MSSRTGCLGLADAVSPLPGFLCDEHSGGRRNGSAGRGIGISSPGVGGAHEKTHRIRPQTGVVMGAVAVCTALSVFGSVWYSGPVSAETVVGDRSSASMTVSDWLPSDYTRGMKAEDLAGYTLADLRLANAHFSPSLVPWALRTSYCESRNDDAQVGAVGERGRWQIHPLWIDNDWTPEVQEIHALIRGLGHEPTVENLALPEVNATVANYIVNEYGPSPWTSGGGCEGW